MVHHWPWSYKFHADDTGRKEQLSSTDDREKSWFHKESGHYYHWCTMAQKLIVVDLRPTIGEGDSGNWGTQRGSQPCRELRICEGPIRICRRGLSEIGDNIIMLQRWYKNWEVYHSERDERFNKEKRKNRQAQITTLGPVRLHSHEDPSVG